MSDNMTKRAKEYMNADFVYEDYKKSGRSTENSRRRRCDSNFGTIN